MARSVDGVIVGAPSAGRGERGEQGGLRLLQIRSAKVFLGAFRLFLLVRGNWGWPPRRRPVHRTAAFHDQTGTVAGSVPFG
jgi:hypothetical protein